MATRSELMIAELNALIQRPKDKLNLLCMYYKTFGNYTEVMRNAKKRNYPFEARLRNGKSMRIDKHGLTYFIVLYYSKLKVIDINDETLQFEFDGRRLTIHGRNYADLKTSFVDQDYDVLNVNSQTVIDVGANVGDTPIYFALRGAKRVIAFEPFPTLYYLAKRNVEENGLSDKITLVNAGCGKDGTVRIKPDQQANSGSKLVDQSEGIEIPTYSLNTIVEKFNVEDRSVLKVDCEGCEYDLIGNASEDVLKKFNQMIIEYHDGYSSLVRKLRGSGFRVKHTMPKRDKNFPAVGYIYAWRD